MDSHKRTLILACWFLHLSLTTTCLSQAPQTAQSHPAESLNQATELALALGVKHLQQLAENDPQGWIIPPVEQSRITGRREVVKRYRLVEIEVPIYEYAKQEGGSSSSGSSTAPKRQAIRQIGIEKKTLVRLDPNGPLEKTFSEPIFEKVGDTSWRFSLIGDSAMALHALRCAGLPESDPVVQRMVENLTTFLNSHGAPEQTWNLAWLAVVMARTEGADATRWTHQLASRLLDSQITDGPAAGLWGPMSHTTRLLAAMMRSYFNAAAELKKCEAKLKERDTSSNQKAVREAQDVESRLKREIQFWSPDALRFAEVELPRRSQSQDGERVVFSASTEYFYNQRSADLASTWVALHALAFCADAKRLPAESLRPSTPDAADGKKSAAPHLLPPETALAVMGRSANALAALHSPDSGWHECNFHQPVRDFDDFPQFLSVPVDAESFPPLTSPYTAASAAQGLAALDCIARIVGRERMAKFQPHWDSGARAFTKALQSWSGLAWPKPERATKLPDDGSAMLLAASPFLKDARGDDLTRLLILAADASGGWTLKPSKRVFIPSSLRARQAALQDLPGQIWAAASLTSPVAMNKAHLQPETIKLATLGSPSGAFATAVAICQLAARLETPAAVLQLHSANPELPALFQQARQQLLKAPSSTLPAPGSH